jgi:hypothetical protein
MPVRVKKTRQNKKILALRALLQERDDAGGEAPLDE